MVVQDKRHDIAEREQNAAVSPWDSVSDTEPARHHTLVLPSSAIALVLVADLVGSVLAAGLAYLSVFLLPLDRPVLRMRPSTKNGCRQDAGVTVANWEGGLVGNRSLSFWQDPEQPAAPRLLVVVQSVGVRSMRI